MKIPKNNSLTYEVECNQLRQGDKNKVPSINKDKIVNIDFIIHHQTTLRNTLNTLQVNRDNDNHLFTKLIALLSNENNKIILANPLSFNEKSKTLCVSLPERFNGDFINFFLTLIADEDSINKKNFIVNFNYITLILELLYVFLKVNQKETENILDKIIIPLITKDNCVDAIKVFYSLYSENKHFTQWYSINEILKAAISTAAKNLNELLKEYNNIKSTQQLPLQTDILEEIFEKYFENEIYNTENDHSLVITSLIGLREISDIFHLVEYEHKTSEKKFKGLHKKGLKPSITWKVSANDKNANKESEAFLIGNGILSIILVNNYDSNEDEYSLGIKLNNEDNAKGNNFIIPLVSICEIVEINFISKTSFVCIFSNISDTVRLCKIENFSQKFKDKTLLNYEFTLNIYFSFSFNLACILNYLSRNFLKYSSLNSITVLTKRILIILLKLSSLKVNSENDVLNAVSRWLSNKPNRSANDACDVLRYINWNLVSLESLISFSMTQSKFIQESEEIRQTISKELEDRINSSFYHTNQTSIMNDNSQTELEHNARIKRDYISKANNNTSEESINISLNKRNIFDEITMCIAKCFEKEKQQFKELDNTSHSNNSNSNIISTCPQPSNVIQRENYAPCNTNTNYYIAKTNNIIKNFSIQSKKGFTNGKVGNPLSSPTSMINSPKSTGSAINNIMNINLLSQHFPKSNQSHTITNNFNHNNIPRGLYIFSGTPKDKKPKCNIKQQPGKEGKEISPQRNANIVNCENKEVKSKSLISERKIPGGKIYFPGGTNQGASAFPNYLKGINQFKSNSTGKSNLSNEKIMKEKQKVQNYIEVAKRETKVCIKPNKAQSPSGGKENGNSHAKSMI